MIIINQVNVLNVYTWEKIFMNNFKQDFLIYIFDKNSINMYEKIDFCNIGII